MRGYYRKEMFMNFSRLLFFTIVSLLGATSIAANVTLNQEYLGGKWSFDGKEGCNSNAAEYVVFHRNVLMDAGKGAVPKAVGFWSTKDDEIIVHLLVAPQESDTSNVFYRGRYTYSYLTAKVLETRQGAFDMISGTTGDMTKKTLTKCD
jgi:hypothetical protein